MKLYCIFYKTELDESLVAVCKPENVKECIIDAYLKGYTYWRDGETYHIRNNEMEYTATKMSSNVWWIRNPHETKIFVIEEMDLYE